MKLLSKNEVKTLDQRQHEELFEKNNRLADFLSKGIKRFNTIKDNYDQDKLNKQREFESFCDKLNRKKSDLLKDFQVWQKAVEEQKDLYYALIEKKDELIEREARIKSKEEQLQLRENFNLENEARLKSKLDTLIKH